MRVLGVDPGSNVFVTFVTVFCVRRVALSSATGCIFCTIGWLRS